MIYETVMFILVYVSSDNRFQTEQANVCVCFVWFAIFIKSCVGLTKKSFQILYILVVNKMYILVRWEKMIKLKKRILKFIFGLWQNSIGLVANDRIIADNNS